MLKLSKKSLQSLDNFFKESARNLEKYLYLYHFREGNPQDIIEVLKNYQNEDGGFGNALEPDFRLPDSSPLATSIGLRTIDRMDGLKYAEQIVKAAINYLESTFNEERKGWYALPPEVNDYPHTPWWHYDEEKEMTVIDLNWGNPTAEILAYLYKYRDFVERLDIEYLIDYALYYIDNKQKFESENELFCYIRLYDVLPKNYKRKLEKNISKGISQVISYNRQKWIEYVPQPLDFVPDPEKDKFGISKAKIKENLDFYVNLLEKKGVITPPWGDSYYQDDLEPAYDEWKGILTLKIIKRLDNYDRIER